MSTLQKTVIHHLLKLNVGQSYRRCSCGRVPLMENPSNLNIHLHGLVLDGVYCTTGEGAPVFHPAPALTSETLQALLAKIIARILRLLTRSLSDSMVRQARSKTAPLLVNYA